LKPSYGIIVIGAGPAGMAAATLAANKGASVLLLDEGRAAGGQIYRDVAQQKLQDKSVLGSEYYAGASLVTALAASNAEHLFDATVWQVSEDLTVGISHHGKARMLQAKQIIIATGAQERPFPITGWTLPGVMNAGAAQVLLKSSGVAQADGVFVGTGPLLYLIATQYLRAGVPIKAILDTTPKGNKWAALHHLPAAIASLGGILKGYRWIHRLKASNMPFYSNVTDLRCTGTDAVETIDFRQGGVWQSIKTKHVFLHQGVVPNINLAVAAGCKHSWDTAQLCWHAQVNSWRESSISGVFIAGDGASISGAIAAEYTGRLAALGALLACGTLTETQATKQAISIHKALAKEIRIRPFLDALFKPVKTFRIPNNDATIVCRCEEVTAGEIRTAVQLGAHSLSHLKSFTRCGMGPCQGRFCALTATEIIAETCNISAATIPDLSLRLPIKPLLINELINMVEVEK